MLDRYSSGILGRPFAIAESDIDVPLPFDANDEYLISAGMCSLDSIPPSMARPTEVSVFIFCIHLRRISSRVHSTFYTGRSSAPPGGVSGASLPEFKSIGHVYSAFAQYRKELRDWRSTAPIFPSPRSLYERAEWHDFLLEKDLLLLARGAMHNIPSRPYAGAAVKEILNACYVSASRIIELYADLMDKRAITWTRSYFQVIFTAGLTVTFCVRLADTEIQQRDPVKTLDVCSGILSFFKDKMPDAGSAAVVFDVVKDECLKDKSHPMNPITAATVSMNPNTTQPDQLPPGTSSHDVHQAYNAAFEALSQDNNELNLNMDHFSMNYALNSQELSLGLTDDLMMQLEAGLGEYAWGSIPTHGNFWDQMPFNY